MLVLTASSPTVGQKMQVPDVGNYSKFEHQTAYHARLPCLLCHKRDTNSATPQFPGGASHMPCAGCHTKQFADKSNAICTICHTDPQSGSMRAFPSLKSFSMSFDHSRHGGTSCSTCHRPSRGGIALTIPAGFNAHSTCFGCHGPNAKSGERDISSCGVCHQAGKLSRTSQTAAAFRVGFSHANHNADERLSCNACHQVRMGSDGITAPQPLNHHASGRSLSCASCHNGKKAFGGDDFSTCKRCHKGAAWRF